MGEAKLYFSFCFTYDKLLPKFADLIQEEVS